MIRFKQYLLLGAAALMSASCSDFWILPRWMLFHRVRLGKVKLMRRNLLSVAMTVGKTEEISFIWTVRPIMVITTFHGKVIKTLPTVK